MGIDGVEGEFGNDPYSNANAVMSLDKLGRTASTLGVISGVQRIRRAVEMLIQWINVASNLSHKSRDAKPFSEELIIAFVTPNLESAMAVKYASAELVM